MEDVADAIPPVVHTILEALRPVEDRGEWTGPAL